MTDVQLENGYTSIANELLSAVVLFDFSKREAKVFLAIVRQTYGWNKKFDRIALSQFAKMTGLKSNHVSTTLKSLLAKNVVLKQDQMYAINKDYSSWIGFENSPKTVLETEAELVPKQDQSQNRTSPDSGLQTSPKTGLDQSQNRTKTSPKTVTTKETKTTITKERKEKKTREALFDFEIPVWIDQKIWDEFMRIRQKLKAVNTEMAMTRLVSDLDKFKNAGHDPNEIIMTSISSSWKGVFQPKTPKINSGESGSIPDWLKPKQDDYIEGEVIPNARLQ